MLLLLLLLLLLQRRPFSHAVVVLNKEFFWDCVIETVSVNEMDLIDRNDEKYDGPFPHRIDDGDDGSKQEPQRESDALNSTNDGIRADDELHARGGGAVDNASWRLDCSCCCCCCCCRL